MNGDTGDFIEVAWHKDTLERAVRTIAAYAEDGSKRYRVEALRIEKAEIRLVRDRK